MARYDQGGVQPRYPTKKTLKEAAAAGVPFTLESTSFLVRGYSGSVMDLPDDLEFVVVGPDPERKRDWYATVKKKNGKVVVI